MERVEQFLKASGDLKYQVAKTLSGEILSAAHAIRERLANGGKLLLMGNGGSAADSQHIAAELIGRFKKERKAIPALALTVDSSSLTALGNDYGFDTIFSRQDAKPRIRFKIRFFIHIWSHNNKRVRF